MTPPRVSLDSYNGKTMMTTVARRPHAKAMETHKVK